MPSGRSAYSEPFEEREERVGGPVSAGWGAERGGAWDRLFFERRVGVFVDVGGLGGLVAEPEGDRRDVDLGCPEEHRGGVPERVRADALARERGAARCCRGGVFADEQLNCVSAERCSSPAGKQRVVGLALAFLEP